DQRGARTYLANRKGRSRVSYAATRLRWLATYFTFFLAQHVFPQHSEPLQQSPAKAPTVMVSAITRAIRPEVIVFINNAPIRWVSNEQLVARKVPRQKRNGESGLDPQNVDS